MRRRPPQPAQIELSVSLVALTAAAAGLVEALLALLVEAPQSTPHWARPAAAGSLAFVALVSLLIGRLRAGPSLTSGLGRLRWVALGVALAAAGVALAAALS